MRGKNVSLRRQFLTGILSAFLIIASLSGAIQLSAMKRQIVDETNNQAKSLVNTVLRVLERNDIASKAIEHQIDLKLVSYSKHIATLLQGKTADQITRNELIKIRDELGLAGITILRETESKDDIVGIAATEKQEVGFSFKKFGYYEVGKTLLNGQKPVVPGATFSDKFTLVLPIVQSGSHTEKPQFFKYAYFHVPGTNYIINPYIKANEVYNFTEIVGPNVAIDRLVKESEIVSEIAVLNPKVFADPSLEKKLYPPLKKVTAGTFNLGTNKEKHLLTQSRVKKTHYIETVNGKKFYKMLYPIDENQVVFLALDYEKLSGPLYRHSIILIVSGLVSLLVLFSLIVRFFNQIYGKMQKIIGQIKLLESGDLTAKSEINDGSELDKLSKSTNRMVDKLNNLVKDTQDQATKTQKFSMLLEAEASQSVERMYDLSTTTTILARDQLFEIMEFLDDLGQVLQPNNRHEKVQELLKKLEYMREMAQYRTHATTEITITLSDLLKSLHEQSSELSEISNTLLEQMGKFKL